jgi:hypothetical protein
MTDVLTYGGINGQREHDHAQADGATRRHALLKLKCPANTTKPSERTSGSQ